MPVGVLQLVETACLHGVPVLHYDDTVAFLDCRKAMCHHHRRAALHDEVKRVLHDLLAFLV